MSNELRFNLNCTDCPDWINKTKHQPSIGDMTLIGDPFIPINPQTKDPYFYSFFEKNDAVWVGQKITPKKHN